MQQPSVSTSATTSRAARPRRSFGGPEALNLREVPAPLARTRGRSACASPRRISNPMDWLTPTSDAEAATRSGLSLPSGFGTDYARVVDMTRPVTA